LTPLKYANPNQNIDRFAIRCFRDTGDLDYIAARLCYRSGLIPQFHWQALQCLEKYFKTIFLLNRVKAKNISHDLDKALRLFKELPFEIKLSESSYSLIDHLTKFGKNRYFEYPYYLHGPKLVELDKTVWEIRHYCYQMNYSVLLNNKYVSLLETHLKMINESLSPKNTSSILIPNLSGKLEEIVSNKDHISRGALVWQNAFFGLKRRKVVKQQVHALSENSPLSLNPSLVHEINDYVALSKPAMSEYKMISQKGKNEGN
jgi:hypothetical protein